MPKYKIPLKDSLVVGHINPDGDSLSSIKAIINYLHSKNKIAVTKIIGTIPNNLNWILEEKDTPHKLPEVEQTIVVDCKPLQDRVGFKINGDKPIVNIDHHVPRISDHDPKHNIFILDRCSTAAALILDFKIKDSVLLAGLYKDTLFAKKWHELNECFQALDVSDERAEEIMSVMISTTDTKVLTAIQNVKYHRCRNGFLIVETNEKDPMVVNEIMDTSFHYAQNVCLVDGNNKARFRSADKYVIEHKIISDVAHLFNGGGHDFAAGADVNGKRTALFDVIKHLDIERNKDSY